MIDINLDSGVNSREQNLLASMLEVTRVFWITILLNLLVYELARFGWKSIIKFY